jgi:hypothetical protein
MDILDIKKSINTPKSQVFITRASEIYNKHDLHITGNGLHKYLDKIEGIEDNDAVSLRKALAKEATVPVMGNIVAQCNKIFTASGGGKFYDISSEQKKKLFIQKLDNATKGGESLNNWMQVFWQQKVNIDPNGIAFVEISENGERAYVTYKSSGSIVDIQFTERTIESILLMFGETPDGKKIYRYVDSFVDQLYVDNSGYPTLIDSIDNFFGRVPAIFLSNNPDTKTNKAFQTWVYESIPNADELLLDHTIYNIYKAKQGIPYVWEYQSECPTCEGSGYIETQDNTAKCSSCTGTGINMNRTVGEVRYLPLPESGDIALTPPAGYVQPDLRTWDQMEATQDRLEKKMFTAVWGQYSDINKSNSNTTAYEVAIRSGNQKDKLDRISANAEDVETFITDLLGQFYLGNAYGGTIISYGRRYITQDSNQIWEEYTKALKDNVSSTELNQLLESYYYSLYAKNPKKLNESLNKLNTKPFFHYTPEQLQKMNVAESDYLGNLYYDSFIVEYEKTNSISTSTISEIQTALNNYISSKSINILTNTES